jgi:cytochrome c oxidase subunit 3
MAKITTSAWSIGGNQPMNAEYGKMMMWFFLMSDALTFSGFLTAYAFVRFRFEAQWPVAEDVFTHFPGLQGDQPLLYVAFMTFVLIMSSVTMVLAVNAGHQLKKNLTAWWMVATIIGGIIFVGSQAWEWYHFIIGDKGAIELSTSEVYKVANKEGMVLSLSQVVHGMQDGHSANHEEKFSDNEVLISIKSNDELVLQAPGKDHLPMTRKETLKALKNAHVVQGANMYHNEYGKQQFANFFFFITGFHGFHVFSGVVLNVLVFYNVMLGTYDRRKTYGMVEKVGLYWHFVDLVWVFVFTFFYLV